MSSKHLYIFDRTNAKGLRPPVMTLIQCAVSSGRKVTLVDTPLLSHDLAAVEKLGVNVIQINGTQPSKGNLIKKAIAILRYRKAAHKIIDDAKDIAGVWVTTADTAITIGPSFFQKKPCVLQINELYDAFPSYTKKLKKIAPLAKLTVVPELGRAHILRHWLNISHTPTVIPNKPLEHPRNKNMPLGNPELTRRFDAIFTPQAKTVLYQGILHPERELRNIARAIREMGSPWKLVLMGNDYGAVSAIKEICPATEYIQHIPAPGHLVATSRARIGVVSYSHSSLNTVFCAPNKIWEYSGFGVPTLCQDMPSMRLLEQCYGRYAQFADIYEPDSIASSLRAIDDDYDALSAMSTAFYDAFDVKKAYSDAIEKVCPLKAAQV